jgi:hypothetical protein
VNIPPPLLWIVGLFVLVFVTYHLRRLYNKKFGSTPTVHLPSAVKNGVRIRWVFASVGLAILLTWVFTSSWGKNKAKTLPVSPETITGIPVVQPEYEWYWKLPRNVFIRGKNEKAPDERKAEVIFRVDGSIRADIPYFEDGSPEIERLRLTKVGPNTWEGTWDQDNPVDSAHVIVDMVAPGVYAGTITFKSEIVGRCRLRRTK